ncbi:class I SAM-dependent methyltransferase [Francisella salimarina]|uniref:class I SAM-dependent methyltransferase n=1 Tax=Francisella salimarina TaxID=2599927 RepID=UPI0037514DA4
MSNNNLWEPKSYNSIGKFVTEYGNEIVELLGPQKDEKILDIGCGTGELTNKIRLQGASIVGIDVSNQMLNQAKKNYPNIEFIEADAQQNLPFNSESFNAVFSNAALHWMLNPTAVIKNVNKILKKNGRFVLEMGGKGNIKNLLASLDKASQKYAIQDYALENFYPSISEYTSLLESNGFLVKYAILFERPTLLEGSNGFRNWAMTFRKNLLDKVTNTNEFLEYAERIAKPYLYKSNKWYADYVRLRVIAYKTQ